MSSLSSNQDPTRRACPSPASKTPADQGLPPLESSPIDCAQPTTTLRQQVGTPTTSLQQSPVIRPTPLEPTACLRTPLACAADVPTVPEMQVGSTIADDEHSVATAGNSPLLDTVARDAGESMPAVLAGTTGPSAGGDQTSALEPRPLNPATEEDEQELDLTKPIIDVHMESAPISGTHHHGDPPRPIRRVIDLTNPPELAEGNIMPKRKDDSLPPTYASVLKQSADNTTQSDVKCYLSRPSRTMLLKLMELAEKDSTTDDEMFEAIQNAWPYPKRVGTGIFWIETSTALISETNDKIIRSIMSDNGDKPWISRMPDFLQVNKARGGDVVVTVTSEETRLAMLGQTVSILGTDYKVSAPKASTHKTSSSKKKQSGLDDLYYMDIVGTRYNFDAQLLLRGLRRLKTNPLYVSVKSTYDSKHYSTVMHPNIWRVYFNQSEQPPALLVNGLVVDELVLQGVRYGVFVKNYVKQTTPRQGRASQHCIDLDKLLHNGNDNGTNEPPAESNIQKRQRLPSTECDGIQTQTKQTETSVTNINRESSNVEVVSEIVAPVPSLIEGDNFGESQTAGDAFQSMLEDMEVEEFVHPKRPLKLTTNKRTRDEAELNSNKGWITSNMFDALSGVDIQPKSKFNRILLFMHTPWRSRFLHRESFMDVHLFVACDRVATAWYGIQTI
ncbi:hypothetical protein AC1031_012351 [Aphanomyces cochlioides]|nr:hypothetical protein AC1031_012351 [Aphanomyces cochlioides]